MYSSRTCPTGKGPIVVRKGPFDSKGWKRKLQVVKNIDFIYSTNQAGCSVPEFENMCTTDGKI